MSHSGKSSCEDARQGFLLGVTLIIMDRPCWCSDGWYGEEMQCGRGTCSPSRRSVWIFKLFESIIAVPTNSEDRLDGTLLGHSD